jgi:hypothetical protein
MTKKLRIILINFRFQIGNDYITNIKAKSKRYHWIQKISVLKRLFIQNFCKRRKSRIPVFIPKKNENKNFVEDLPMIIPGQFGFNCPSGFREEAF